MMSGFLTFMARYRAPPERLMRVPQIIRPLAVPHRDRGCPRAACSFRLSQGSSAILLPTIKPPQRLRSWDVIITTICQPICEAIH